MQREIEMPAGDVVLAADLSLPRGVKALVVFVHGSGSSRRSPRNRAVAEHMNGEGLATLLFDLLTPAEERIDRVTRAIRFDIELLAARTTAVVDWLHQAELGLPIGLFGTSTGAAAALVAAAARPRTVGAVVSRGGRPDLADTARLQRVKAPTLLVVGGDDGTVLRLNEHAKAEMRCERELAVVPGATHLFEEPGALEQVCALASGWFDRHLAPEATPAR